MDSGLTSADFLDSELFFLGLQVALWDMHERLLMLQMAPRL